MITSMVSFFGIPLMISILMQGKRDENTYFFAYKLPISIALYGMTGHTMHLLSSHFKDMLCVLNFGLFLTLNVCCCILGVIGFWRIQRYKATIAGPWDYDTTNETAQSLQLFAKLKG